MLHTGVQVTACPQLQPASSGRHSTCLQLIIRQNFITCKKPSDISHLCLHDFTHYHLYSLCFLYMKRFLEAPV